MQTITVNKGSIVIEDDTVSLGNGADLDFPIDLGASAATVPASSITIVQEPSADQADVPTLTAVYDVTDQEDRKIIVSNGSGSVTFTGKLKLHIVAP